jgi:hypothetical protein
VGVDTFAVGAPVVMLGAWCVLVAPPIAPPPVPCPSPCCAPSLTSLVHFSAAYNSLHTTGGLGSLAQLETLNLSHNNLRIVTGLETLQRLRRLDLSVRDMWCACVVCCWEYLLVGFCVLAGYCA